LMHSVTSDPLIILKRGNKNLIMIEMEGFGLYPHKLIFTHCFGEV